MSPMFSLGVLVLTQFRVTLDASGDTKVKDVRFQPVQNDSRPATFSYAPSSQPQTGRVNQAVI